MFSKFILAAFALFLLVASITSAEPVQLEERQNRELI